MRAAATVLAGLDSLGISDTDRVLTLSVGPALLRFAAGAEDVQPLERPRDAG